MGHDILHVLRGTPKVKESESREVCACVQRWNLNYPVREISRRFECKGKCGGSYPAADHVGEKAHDAFCVNRTKSTLEKSYAKREIRCSRFQRRESLLVETQAVSGVSQDERNVRGTRGRIARLKSSLSCTTVTGESYIVQVTSHRS